MTETYLRTPISKRGVLCFGCGGLCRGNEHVQMLTPERAKGSVSYFLSSSGLVFRPSWLAIYLLASEPFASLLSVRLGLVEQLVPGCDLPIRALFTVDETPAELVARPVIPPHMAAMNLGVLDIGAQLTITTSRPVRDILLIGAYLEESEEQRP